MGKTVHLAPIPPLTRHKAIPFYIRKVFCFHPFEGQAKRGGGGLFYFGSPYQKGIDG